MRQVKAHVREQIGIVELDNPPDQMMTNQMVSELDELTAKWEQDENVRAIVITGAVPGKFITHYSLDELESGSRGLPPNGLPQFAERVVERIVRGVDASQWMLDLLPGMRHRIELSCPAPLRGLLKLLQINRLFSRLERMDKVVIAAINGTAMGAGCELALACDYRLMARGDFVIGLIEVLAGSIPGAGGTQRLPMIVGRGKALEMLLDGQLLSANEAERIGLITRAVDADQLMPAALELARRMATRPLSAVGYAKRVGRVGTSLPVDDGLMLERTAMAILSTRSDARKLGAYYLSLFRQGRSARQIFHELRERGVGVF
jgi:enoyl-CoA hydratase